MYNALRKLKVNKASCDNLLSNKLLLSLADVFAAPICSLINASIAQGVVPTQWKVARVSPIPKINPPVSIETDLRPISVTSGISKVAEFFISQFFNSHFCQLNDPNQYGCTAGRSTTLALIKFYHICCKASDRLNNIIRVLLIDFSKAFDRVNHNVLFKKFQAYNFPVHIAAWSLSFLEQRKQYICINNRTSNLLTVNAGTPQGTLAGPNDFKLLTNDLDCDDADYVKYVDDLTAISESEDPYDNTLQTTSNGILGWSGSNDMKPNPKKCKESLIYFGKKFNKDIVPLIRMGDDEIERVETFKLLGLVFNNKLTWDDHVSYMLKKVSKRYYFIYRLARTGVPQRDIVLVYISTIRSILEYACAVWHSGLTRAQSEEIERVQMRSLKIIYPDLSYSKAMREANIDRLNVRRENIVRHLFEEIKKPGHVLNDLLTPRKDHGHNTRNTYMYEIPAARTQRFLNSFIPYCLRKKF